MRRLIGVTCEGETLAATLDEAPGMTGLLIVSGGNEIRSGAHRGMAMLAQRLAATGTPVFRYDRRGVGDSTGDNGGFLSAEPDLIAAVAEFRHAAPHVARLIGFGNCDAASTLALFGRSAGLDKVVLANPWVIEPIDELPPASAIRHHYRTVLRDPATWRRVLSGKLSNTNLIKGLLRIAQTDQESRNPLASRVLTAIATWQTNAAVILARGDGTAIAFAAAAGAAVPSETIDTDSHSFTGPAAAALETALRRNLA
jgi:exosortase A-associated hydrolase 1